MTTMRQQPLFSFLPFLGFVFFFKYAASLHYTLLAPLGERFFSDAMLGILIGGTTFVQLLLDVPAGHMLDRYGYKRLLLVGTALFICVAAFLVPGLTAVTYLAMITLSIFGWLFFTPGINAYILSEAPDHMAGRILSWKDTASSLAVVCGSGCIGFFIAQTHVTLGILFITSLTLAGLFLLYAQEEKQVVNTTSRTIENIHYHLHRTHLFDTMRAITRLNPASSILILLSIASSLFYAVVWFVIPLELARTVHTDIPAFALGIFDVSVVILGSSIGTLADTWDQRRLVGWGILLFAVCGMGIGFNTHILFLVFGFLATTGEETATLSLWTWLHALDANHQHDGLVASIISFAQDLGWAIGPILAGFAYASLGMSLSIFYAGTTVFIVWILYFLFSSTRHAPHPVCAAPKKPHIHRHKH